MNATPSIFEAAQRSSHAAQTSTPSSPSQPSQAGGRDFAATLSDAGTKPARKHASGKHPGTAPSGGQLPAPGNPPPPALGPPPPAQAELRAGAQAKDTAGAAPVAQAGNAAADPTAKPAPTVADDAATAPKAVGAPAAVGDAALLLAADLNGATSTTAAAASATADAASAAAAATSAAAAAAPAAPATVSSGAAVPADPSIPSPGAHSTTTANAAPTEQPVRVVPRDATKSDAALAASTSRPASTDGNSVLNDQTLSSGPAAADTGAVAQAVMAAAVAQTGTPAIDSTATADDTVAPDSGISLQGMGAANGAPLTAPNAPNGPHAPAAPPAIGAATAAAVVQSAQGAADAGAADRHSRGNSPDASLSVSTNDGTGGAAQLLTSNAPADTAPLPTFKIPAGVDTADFGQGVADRVSLMMDGNLSSAKLQVNPPALGPIEVRIALQAGHAQVWLSSHSAVTRDALESSAPRLREMLGSQGFAQVSVDISQRSFQERSPQSHAYEATPAIGDSPAITPASTAISRAANGLLDAYA